jgi:hypothetical protein
MSQRIQATPRPAQATLVPKAHLPRLRAELEQQQRFRLSQIDELASEAALAADDARRQVIRALIRAAEWALGDINWALNGSTAARTEPVNAALRPSRSSD